MIIALAMAAHWVAWKPELIQMGVALGAGADEHLIAFIPAEGCGAGVKIYDGKYGDLDKATAFLARSKVCAVVDDRRKLKSASGH